MTATPYLSPHFTLEEMTASPQAQRLGIDNTPPPGAVQNLRLLAAVLEELRQACEGKPIHISSGYRCPTLNHLIGSKPTSAHIQGLAADFTVQDMSCLAVIHRAIDYKVPYDQLIYEGTWVHLAIAPLLVNNRSQVLTAHFKGGQVTYSAGVPAA